MYINLWYNSRGIPKVFVVCKIVSDKTICKAFRIHNKKTIREFFLFSLPNLYIGFKKLHYRKKY